MHRSTTNRSVAPASSTKGTRQYATGASLRTIGGASSSHVSSAKNKSAEKQSQQKVLPRIIDELGNDVTPKPLFENEAAKPRHASSLFHSMEGTTTPTDLLSTGSILATNIMMTAGGGGGGGGQSYAGMPESTTHMSTDSTHQPTSDSINDSVNGDRREREALFLEALVRRNEIDTQEKIHLRETDTYWLIDLKSTCVSNDDPQHDFIKQNNEKYVELCKNKVGNDSYAERGMNTFNDLPKQKTTQTERITINDAGCWATAWDIYDSLLDDEQQHQQDGHDDLKADTSSRPISVTSGSNNKVKAAGGINNKTVASQMTAASVTVVSESSVSAQPMENHEENKIKGNYHNSESFKQNTFFMERLLNQNNYQSKQAKYRGMRQLSIEQHHEQQQKSKEDKRSISKMSVVDTPSLEKLWNYSSTSLTKDRNVSCITWNKRNKDIVAIGYGKFEYNDDTQGLVCCWSLKNPEYPERYYKTEAGVTAVAFSEKHANLLAVGLFNGSILIYDVRNNNTAPLLTSNETETKHLSPVWSLKWADRDRNQSNGKENHAEANGEEDLQVIMSISTDGRVSQWMIRKGFESSDYLKLKRILNKQTLQQKKDKDKGQDGFISRYAGGLCFDIYDQDKSIYLCGTEEGLIHRCSVSYNEQYLDTYSGHKGPVYKIAWSPFLKNAFLSASGDWTIRLWKVDRFDNCLSFNSSTKAVYDISWSHTSATVFCCVNENAIELWDLSKSTLDPIYVTQPIPATKLTTISYAPNSDSILVGTSDGNLLVYAIKNMPAATNAHQLDDIIRQSLLGQDPVDDSFNTDDVEAVEKQQMEMAKLEDEEKIKEQNEKLDAVVSKLDKIKKQQEQLGDRNLNDLKIKETLKVNDNKKIKKSGDESSSDEN